MHATDVLCLLANDIIHNNDNNYHQYHFVMIQSLYMFNCNNYHQYHFVMMQSLYMFSCNNYHQYHFAMMQSLYMFSLFQDNVVNLIADIFVVSEIYLTYLHNTHKYQRNIL